MPLTLEYVRYRSCLSIFQLSSLHDCQRDGEEGGESSFAAVVEKTMQQTCIKGIVVNNRITNVLGKKIGTMCAKLKREKRKSGGFGVKRLTNKWRHQTYSVKLFYHELDNYCTENERQTNLRRMALPSDRNLRKSSTTQRETASITKKDSNVVSFHSLCDFVYGCHSDRMKVRLRVLLRRIVVGISD